ncbi:MAG: SET domain-containing protein-lysine N-methyltransferase [Bacteroidetes bacterium]|nr:SET domain-containing protein-lysine N-methyltransferase [Bacteroidota bacterium]
MGTNHTPFLEVRASNVHGTGAFAARRIRKGTRIIEYLGERISAEEADRRYDDDAMEFPHVWLFSVDENTILDGDVGGSDAKYLNHCCEPNCETEVDGGRVFIYALRTIQAGEELTYDYHLDYDGEYTPEVLRKFACHCSAATCRGTMLAPR